MSAASSFFDPVMIGDFGEEFVDWWIWLTQINQAIIVAQDEWCLILGCISGGYSFVVENDFTQVVVLNAM